MRGFLWKGKDFGSRRAPISWAQMCLPKTCGGWNLKDLITWNAAAVIKHCWALSMTQDRLWVKWVHMYYIKKKDFLTTPIANGLTWSLWKIWQSREILQNAGGGEQFVHASKFRIQKVYAHIREVGPKVDWRRLICNNKGSLKSTFTLWMAIENRLTTTERLLN